ncbi:MAG: hypothetical protein ACRCW2_07320 [Cellulosilyticaceae bacterium]
MINNEKVKIMTQMAINDKYYTQKDKRIVAYYPEDYVYLSNFKSRIMIFLLVAAAMAGHLLLRVNNGLNMPTTVEEIVFRYALPYGGALLVILVIYTMISSRYAKKKYRLAAERMEAYQKLSSQLEVYDKEREEKYGFKRKRTHYQREDDPVL